MNDFQSKLILPPVRERFNGVTQTQYLGLLTLLVGVSQLPVGYSFAIDNNSWTFVVLSGGWLLIGIGFNLMIGRPAFYSDWGESDRLGIIALVALTLLTIAVVVSSVYGLF